jgi:hypothetical protein
VSCSLGERHGHTGCVTEDGRAYFWGDPYKGMLGNLEAWTHKVKGFVDLP